MKGLVDTELKLLIRSVGTHRGERVLSPAEVSRLLARATRAGVSRSECAKTLDISTTQVSAFLKLAELPDAVQHLSSWGTSRDGIAFSTLGLLTQLNNTEDQVAATTAILEYGFTWKEVVQITQITDRAEGGLAGAIEAVLALRPEIETRRIFIGLITSDTLKEALVNRTQAERDVLIDRTLGFLGAPSDVTGRLGVSSFTLVGSGDDSEFFASADALEEQVNHRLKELVDG